MKREEQPKLSVSLALQGLQEVAEEIARVESHLADLRAARDRVLIDAYGHVSVTKLARLAGLSRERVSKIASGVVRPRDY